MFLVNIKLKIINLLDLVVIKININILIVYKSPVILFETSRNKVDTPEGVSKE